MTHNNEEDRYRNNSLIAKFEYEFNDDINFFSNIRLADTYLQYDKELNIPTATHSEEVDGIETSSSLGLNYKLSDKFKNKITIAKTYIKRTYAATVNSGNPAQDNYYGDRYALMYLGDYKLNLDNNIILGFEKEFDKIGYNKDLSGKINKHNYVNSTFFDYQTRLTNNFYLTLGSRFDSHSIVGNEDSHRITSAYVFDDKLLKIKSSFGTGFRYPSLYEMYFVYAANANSLRNVNAEKSRSYDIGFEKTFPGVNLIIDATYFNLKYFDVLEGWKSGTSSGSEYTTQNMSGTVKSQGLEIISNYKYNNNLNFNLNYTYTSTYDGAEQDDPDKSSSYTNAQMVRVPRNIVNLATNFQLPKNKKINFLLNTKWSDTARDYGNGNRTYDDEMVDDYLINDLYINCELLEKYNLFLNVTNIFNEKYETTRDYNQLGRTLNIGLKSNF